MRDSEPSRGDPDCEDLMVMKGSEPSWRENDFEEKTGQRGTMNSAGDIMTVKT